MTENNNKHLLVSEGLHTKLKTKAAKRKIDLKELVEELLIKALEE